MFGNVPLQKPFVYISFYVSDRIAEAMATRTTPDEKETSRVSAFTAIRIDQDEAGYRAAYVALDASELMDGDVDVEVTHSTVNYKDGLAVTGKAPVVRRFPMIPGVDFAGVVTRSSHPNFRAGEQVIAGGLRAGRAALWRLRAARPRQRRLAGPFAAGADAGAGDGDRQRRLHRNALRAGAGGPRLEPSRGPVIVTGAAGGVGSVAVALLAALGWRVVASTGRPQEEAYLKELGAAEIVDRAELSAPGKPLQKQRFAGGVDTVGSVTLANVLAQTAIDGVVAACGNAQGMELPTTVAPFILRGVSLIGVESVRPNLPLRRAGWERLACDLDKGILARMTETAPSPRRWSARDRSSRARSEVGWSSRSVDAQSSQAFDWTLARSAILGSVGQDVMT